MNTLSLSRVRRQKRGPIDARHVNEAKEATLAAHSAMASGATARQAMVFRVAFNGPAQALPRTPEARLPEHQCEGWGQKKNEGRLHDKARVKADAKAEARAQVADYQSAKR